MTVERLTSGDTDKADREQQTPRWWSRKHLHPKTLTLDAPSVQRRHVGLGLGLMNEDEGGGLDPGLIFLPPVAPPGDRLAFLLSRIQGFFDALAFAVHEIPHRPVIYLQAAFGKPIGEALRVSVATRFDLLQHPLPVRAPESWTEYARLDAARLAIARHPLDEAAGA